VPVFFAEPASVFGAQPVAAFRAAPCPCRDPAAVRVTPVAL